MPFFSQVVFTGSHENAVLALAQGTVDVAANWWNADDDSNLTRMLAKNMVKSSDGTPMKKEDFRIIVKSDLIINSPYAYLSDLPEDMKAAIKQGVPRSRREGQGSFQEALRRQEPAVAADHQRGLQQDHRADQVRRQPAQEGVLIAERTPEPGPATRLFCLPDASEQR